MSHLAELRLLTAATRITSVGSERAGVLVVIIHRLGALEVLICGWDDAMYYFSVVRFCSFKAWRREAGLDRSNSLIGG